MSFEKVTDPVVNFITYCELSNLDPECRMVYSIKCLCKIYGKDANKFIVVTDCMEQGNECCSC